MNTHLRPMRYAIANSILLLVLVSACSAQQPADLPPNACDLLPASEIEAIVGEPVLAENLGQVAATHWSACGYLSQDKQDVWLEIQVTWAGGKDKAEQELEAAAATGRLVPVEGIGDGAWFSTYVGQRALLLKGDILVEFPMALLPDVPTAMHEGDHAALRAQFEPLARSVLSRL